VPVEFKKVTANRWEADDKADKYEVQFGRDIGYGCFKNGILFETEPDLDSALASCFGERIEQEWHSNNPENAELNRQARERRRPQALTKNKRPKLWRGK
jgi:hypothetical protein